MEAIVTKDGLKYSTDNMSYEIPAAEVEGFWNFNEKQSPYNHPLGSTVNFEPIKEPKRKRLSDKTVSVEDWDQYRKEILEYTRLKSEGKKWRIV